MFYGAFVLEKKKRKLVDCIFPFENYTVVEELCGTCVLPHCQSIFFRVKRYLSRQAINMEYENLLFL
jgi:hypothetical protein